MCRLIFFSFYFHGIPWASYQIRKIAGCACAGNAGNVSPRRQFQRKPLVSDPGMHHGTCVTHVPWCMSGSLTCDDGENVPGIPGACAPAILCIWQEAHGALQFPYPMGTVVPWTFMALMTKYWCNRNWETWISWNFIQQNNQRKIWGLSASAKSFMCNDGSNDGKTFRNPYQWLIMTHRLISQTSFGEYIWTHAQPQLSGGHRSSMKFHVTNIICGAYDHPRPCK